MSKGVGLFYINQKNFWELSKNFYEPTNIQKRLTVFYKPEQFFLPVIKIYLVGKNIFHRSFLQFSSGKTGFSFMELWPPESFKNSETETAVFLGKNGGFQKYFYRLENILLRSSETAVFLGKNRGNFFCFHSEVYKTFRDKKYLIYVKQTNSVLSRIRTGFSCSACRKEFL